MSNYYDDKKKYAKWLKKLIEASNLTHFNISAVAVQVEEMFGFSRKMLEKSLKNYEKIGKILIKNDDEVKILCKK